MRKYNVVVIGGGMAGISFYVQYLRKKKKDILIVESTDSLLKKVSVSGNGKCNFTNEHLSSSIYNNPDFIEESLSPSVDKCLEFFDFLNIPYFKDSEGRYYPRSESAKTVIEKIKSKIDSSIVAFNSTVSKIEKEDGSYILSILDKATGETTDVQARNVVIACGNKNYSQLGFDSSIFDLIDSLGISMTSLIPSNVYMCVKENLKQVSGVRIKAREKLLINGDEAYSESGEVLFKDEAISGIVSFNVSNKYARTLREDPREDASISLDLVEGMTIDELKAIYDISLNDSDFLIGFINPKLKDYIINLMKSSNIKPYEILKDLRFRISSLGKFKDAQATSGGVMVEEITTDFESKKHKGLYFIGDILDIDAPSGGYNLSFAMMSGIKVGDIIE